jgi:hypothetical protein
MRQKPAGGGVLVVVPIGGDVRVVVFSSYGAGLGGAAKPYAPSSIAAVALHAVPHEDFVCTAVRH